MPSFGGLVGQATIAGGTGRCIPAGHVAESWLFWCSWRLARRGSGLCGRQPVADRASVPGALRDQHERRHRHGGQHAADLPGRRDRDPDAGRLQRRAGRAARATTTTSHAVRRRRRQRGDVRLLEREPQRSRRGHRPLRRPLLGRRARPGRDAAAAVRSAQPRTGSPRPMRRRRARRGCKARARRLRPGQRERVRHLHGGPRLRNARRRRSARAIRGSRT